MCHISKYTQFFLGILTKGTGTHHLPLSMPNPPTNYSPTLARLLTAPERCKQSRGKRQAPAATVVSSNTVNLLYTMCYISINNNRYYILDFEWSEELLV